MGMITSTKDYAVSFIVRNSQNETSFPPVNYVNDLNKVKNAVLRHSAKGKPSNINIKRTRKNFPELKQQRKY